MLELQVEQVDVVGVVGQEQQALPLDPHRGDALAGERLLHELADASGALVVEVHLPLEGDHGPLPGQDVPVEVDPEHLRVLQGEVARELLPLVHVAEERAAHD